MNASIVSGLTSYLTEDSPSSDPTDPAVNHTGAIVGGKQVFWGYRDTI